MGRHFVEQHNVYRHMDRQTHIQARAYTHNEKQKKKAQKIMIMYQGPKASEQAAQFIVVS